MCSDCFVQLLAANKFKLKCHKSMMDRRQAPTTTTEKQLQLDQNDTSNSAAQSSEITLINHDEFTLLNHSDGDVDDDDQLSSINDYTADVGGDDGGQDPKAYPCDQCKKTFKYIGNLRKHQIYAHNRDIKNADDCLKYYFCNQCDTSFVNPANLSRHLKNVHNPTKSYTHRRGNPNGSRRLKCKFCLVLSETPFENNRHEQEHANEERPYRCNVENCGRRFKGDQGFKFHMDKHANNIRAFECNLCTRTFLNRSNFLRHKQLHAGLNRLLCAQCGKTFASNDIYQTHLRWHRGELPFACPHCPKRFTTKYTLTCHIRLHTNERPFKCETCGKTFPSGGPLRTHRLVHKDVRSFECHLCPAKFLDNNRLQRHLKTKLH